MRRRRWVLLAVVAVVLLAPATALAYPRVAWETPDGQAIRQVVDEAEIAPQTYALPPPAYRHRPIPASILQAQQQRAARTARRLYTGRALKSWLKTFRMIVQGERKPDRLAPTWRMTAIEHQSLWLLPWSARFANATIVTHSRSNSGIVSTWEDSYRLIRTSSGWRIVSGDVHCIDECP